MVPAKSTEGERVLAQIDREELAELALSLGNIDSPDGSVQEQKEMGAFVESWLKKEGFRTRVLALLPERPNVIGVYEGTGGGYSLIFNSHMDTFPSEAWAMTVRDYSRPMDHSAWREGDTIWGQSVVNDKGPMACWLIAAKAIKKAGIALKGNLILTAVSGEIGWSPVDEWRPPRWTGHEVGARYIVAHGVTGDYALVAEATNFRIGWVQAGKAHYKITVYSGQPWVYSPYLQRPYLPEKNPNAINHMSRLIDRLEDWAFEYEKKHTYESAGGTCIPKVCIGAIRGGTPIHTGITPELCVLYLDVRTAPGQDMAAIQEELKDVIRSAKVNAEIEMYRSLRGYEAQNIDRLAQAVERSHNKVINQKIQTVLSPECSMWRDMNAFNEVGIPSATYGPAAASGGGNFCVKLDDLQKAAQIYAMTALDLCNQEKPKV